MATVATHLLHFEVGPMFCQNGVRNIFFVFAEEPR
jgi:hypothetical protein